MFDTNSESFLKQIKSSGVPEENIFEQLNIFKNGIPFINLEKPCIINNGIIKINEFDFNKYLSFHQKASTNGRLMKFVPASGAATRMFKELAYLMNTEKDINGDFFEKESPTDENAKFGLKFFKDIQDFAFYDDLDNILSKNNYSLKELLSNKKYRIIIKSILTEEGLNYSFLPKALIKFHKYENLSRTPLYEHILEAINYACDNNNQTKIHFTVSPEHLKFIKNHINEIISEFQDFKILVDYSIQKTSTNTIAVDNNNDPFYDTDNNLVFRPGGHGALIENLNDLDGDIIFLKNIDNIVPRRLADDTYLYKKLLCGLLIEIQEKIFEYINLIINQNYDLNKIIEIEEFASKNLGFDKSEIYSNLNLEQKAQILYNKLNRPLRVCGVVKNEGEPGGGPFWVKNQDGSLSLQIVESAQVDMNSKEQSDILKNSTHFNPVDLVCAVRDYQNNKFNLLDFSDKNMGFITSKSMNGRQLKAYELPGLWNGAMAHWNTIFVEVPISTFNPVKSVLDLLRPQHR